MNLSPLPIQKFCDNNGRPLVGGLLFTYEAGTTTKVATYTDASGLSVNTNPIELDYRGECRVWLDPLLSYKFTLAPAGDTDPPTNPIWTVDGITINWLTQQIIGEIFYPRTAAEIAAGIVPINYTVPPYPINPLRYGTNTTPGSTDMTAAIQAAMDVGAEVRAAVYLPADAGECRITTNITVSNGRSGLVGDGKGLSLILADNCSGFSCAAGLSFLTFRGFSLAHGVRYTTAPNTHIGIGLNGTTASKCQQPVFEDLFIDGFNTAIDLGCTDSALIDGCYGSFLLKGVKSSGQSLLNTIANSQFVGGNDAGSRGLEAGDGVLNQEGWKVHHSTFFGFQRGIQGFAVLSFVIENNELDSCGDIGVFLFSSATAPSYNNKVCGNYIALAAGATANSGILAVNDHASSGQNGSIYEGNEIVVYPTGTVAYGISLEGTHDEKAVILANLIANASTADIHLAATATQAIVSDNQCYGAGYALDVGSNPSFGATNRGTVQSPLVVDAASAAALTLPVGPRFFNITGTTNITSIVTAGLLPGIYVLQFADVLTFTDGNNLLLSSNFVTSANDTITLLFDGTNFREVARSVN
jgi:hypothetical protein